MIEIKSVDIQTELEDYVTGPDDLFIFIRKYPTRVLVSLQFTIDGKEYHPTKDFYIDSSGEIRIE